MAQVIALVCCPAAAGGGGGGGVALGMAGLASIAQSSITVDGSAFLWNRLSPMGPVHRGGKGARQGSCVHEWVSEFATSASPCLRAKRGASFLGLLPTSGELCPDHLSAPMFVPASRRGVAPCIQTCMQTRLWGVCELGGGDGGGAWGMGWGWGGGGRAPAAHAP